MRWSICWFVVSKFVLLDVTMDAPRLHCEKLVGATNAPGAHCRCRKSAWNGTNSEMVVGTMLYSNRYVQYT